MAIEAEYTSPETKDGEGASKHIELVVNDDCPEQRHEAVIYDDIYCIVGSMALNCYAEKCHRYFFEYSFESHIIKSHQKYVVYVE